MKANYVSDVLDAGSPLQARMGAKPKAQAGYVWGELDQIRRITLRKYFVDQWLPSVEFEVEPTTFQSYRTNVIRHIIPALGDMLLEEVTHDHLKRFYSELLTNDVPGTYRPLSKATVCRIHAVLHRGFRLLVEAGALTTNPAAGARPRKRKLDQYEIRVWSPEELALFLTSTSDDRLGPLWHVIAFTGMRRGEALGLRWHDVREDAGILSVRRALNQVGNYAYVSAPKSAQARVIELAEETLRILRRHRDQTATEWLALGRSIGIRSDDYVFLTEAGVPYLPNLITRAFQEAVARYQLPRIRLHDLRHTHASHLIESGANPKVVQERLGHADVVITLNLYSHLFPTTQRTAIEKLSAFYEPR